VTLSLLSAAPDHVNPRDGLKLVCHTVKERHVEFAYGNLLDLNIILVNHEGYFHDLNNKNSPYSITFRGPVTFPEY
jgi:hypothetical protein